MKKVTLTVDLNNPAQVATKEGYGQGLLKAGGEDPNVVALGADITGSVRVDLFRDAYPERFISCGIAEQDQVGVAAGLALMGKVPFVTNYGVFLAGRAWDQIRTTVCYADLNVKFGGAHGGISVGADGATHQALEEIAIMRCLPNMRVVVPCDAVETEKATLAAAKSKGAIYVRFGREAVPVVTDADTPFELGKCYLCREGKDVAIIACGAMVYQALKAAEILAGEGIDAAVVNCHTIKPIDAESIVEIAKLTGCVVTAEEHQVMGGMGSAVLEVLAKECPVPVEMVGVQDTFGTSGAPERLMKEYHLVDTDIAEAARKSVARKAK